MRTELPQIMANVAVRVPSSPDIDHEIATGRREDNRTAHSLTQPQLVIPRGKAVATIKTVIARLDRAIQYAAASRFIINVSGILGRPIKSGDDSVFVSSFSR